MAEITVTFIPGDGIGPEVARAARRVIDATGAPIRWEEVEAGAACAARTGRALDSSVIESIRRNKVALKGPIATPIGGGFRSVNVALRKELDLYVNLRPVTSYDAIHTRFDKVDLIIVRENTEDLYAGIERMIDDDTAESSKIFTRGACERIARFAFEYAVKHKRRKVTAVHKANIMKLTDGMFLVVARQVAAEYPQIKFEEAIIDALCMRLVMDPTQFDVLLLPNLYGDIVSDLAAGLIGGLGLAPSANIGKDIAVFEPSHGSAPDIAGKNIANPVATILSGMLLLSYLGLDKEAIRLSLALRAVLDEKRYFTADLGGSLGTAEFADEVIYRLS